MITPSEESDLIVFAAALDESDDPLSMIVPASLGPDVGGGQTVRRVSPAAGIRLIAYLKFTIQMCQARQMQIASAKRRLIDVFEGPIPYAEEMEVPTPHA